MTWMMLNPSTLRLPHLKSLRNIFYCRSPFLMWNVFCLLLPEHHSLLIFLLPLGHLAVQLWANVFTSLSLSFPICTAGLIIVLPSRVVLHVEWVSAYSKLSVNVSLVLRLSKPEFVPSSACIQVHLWNSPVIPSLPEELHVQVKLYSLEPT